MAQWRDQIEKVEASPAVPLSDKHALASIAISLKRIADRLDEDKAKE